MSAVMTPPLVALDAVKLTPVMLAFVTVWLDDSGDIVYPNSVGVIRYVPGNAVGIV